MIKVYATINNRRTLILGLSRLNTERLLDDQPIPVDVQALLTGQPRPDNGDKVQDIIIIGGETENTIKEELSQFIQFPEGV